jgi:hypothetical protein
MKDKTLKRLAAIEAREPAVEDDGQALTRLIERYDLIGQRLRAQEGYLQPTREEMDKTAAEFIEYMRLAHGAVPLGPPGTTFTVAT